MCCKYFPSRVSSCHVGTRSVHVAFVHNRRYMCWGCPQLAHGYGTVRPISEISVKLDFYPLQLPPHLMGPSSFIGRTHGVTVIGSGDDGPKASGSMV